MVAKQMNGLLSLNRTRSEMIQWKRISHYRGLIRTKASQFENVQSSRSLLRVLVIDGEHDFADDLAWRLHRYGHDPRTAYDAYSALRVAAIQHPNLVFLNLEMPLMDGCDIARQLRLDFPRQECFLIGFTWRTDEERREESVTAGVDLLLIKPINLSLVETLLMLEAARVKRLEQSNTAS